MVVRNNSSSSSSSSSSGGKSKRRALCLLALNLSIWMALPFLVVLGHKCIHGGHGDMSIVKTTGNNGVRCGHENNVVKIGTGCNKNGTSVSGTDSSQIATDLTEDEEIQTPVVDVPHKKISPEDVTPSTSTSPTEPLQPGQTNINDHGGKSESKGHRTMFLTFCALSALVLVVGLVVGVLKTVSFFFPEKTIPEKTSDPNLTPAETAPTEPPSEPEHLSPKSCCKTMIGCVCRGCVYFFCFYCNLMVCDRGLNPLKPIQDDGVPRLAIYVCPGYLCGRLLTKLALKTIEFNKFLDSTIQ